MANEKGTFYSFFVLLALATGMMLSPDSLSLLGNNMGSMGIYFLIVVLSVMVVHLLTALSYGEMFTLFPEAGSEAKLIKEAFGSLPAVALPLCSRVVFTVSAATGTLATAGYAFNEVFIYWFPNLGFSFILLAFLLGINLMARGVSGWFQVLFVVIALLPLIILSVTGLKGGEPMRALTNEIPTSALPIAASTGLLLFIGYDLALFGKESANTVFKAMIAGICLVGILFCLWGFISVKHVSPERLSDTTIPHVLSARAILGQKGRILMGLVVIAGTCATVNALFIALSRMITGMASQNFLPSFLGKRRVPPLILAGGAGVMMALGMAGEPVLEVYMRAGLCFWLLNYAAVHLSVLIVRRRVDFPIQRYGTGFYNAVPLAGLILIFSGLAGLLVLGETPALLIKSMLVIFFTVFILSKLWLMRGGRGAVHPPHLT